MVHVPSGLFMCLLFVCLSEGMVVVMEVMEDIYLSSAMTSWFCLLVRQVTGVKLPSRVILRVVVRVRSVLRRAQ